MPNLTIHRVHGVLSRVAYGQRDGEAVVLVDASLAPRIALTQILSILSDDEAEQLLMHIADPDRSWLHVAAG